MLLLLFLLRCKWKNLLKQYQNPLVLFVHCIILLVVIGYSIGLIFLFNYLEHQQKNEIIRWLWTGMEAIIFFTPITLLFFPVLSYKTELFEKSYPITPLRKTWIEVVFNFCSPVFLILCLMICIIWIGASPIHYLDAIHAFLLLLLSSIIRLIVQTIFSLQHKKFILVGIVFLTSILVLLYTVSIVPYQHILTIVSLIILSLALYCYTQYQPISEHHRKSNFSRTTYTSLWGILWILQCKNRRLTISVIMAILLKFVFLFNCFNLIKLSNHENFYINFNNILVALTLTSFWFFQYVYNNIWGYIKFTYKILVCTKDIKFLFKSYLILLMPIILFDIIVVTIVIHIQFLKLQPFGTTTQFYIFYFIILVINILIGFIASIHKPIEITHLATFSFKSNTSRRYGTFMLLCLLLMTSLFWFRFTRIYIMPLVIVFVVYLYYKLIIKQDIKKIDNVFRTL